MNISVSFCILGTLAVMPLLQADIITYSFAGMASGSVGSQVFTNATVSATGTADTNSIVNAGVFPFNEIDFAAGSETLTISGIGSGTFANLLYVVDNYGSGVLLLGGLFPTGNADIIELTNSDLGSNVFSNYFLNTSIGPIGPAPDEAVAAWQDIPTSLGDVSLSSYTNVTFQAKVVPEPSSSSLLLTSLLALAFLAKRLTRRPE